MTTAAIATAAVFFASSFVMGLSGFGLALVAMAFLPWLMPPTTAVVVLTIFGTSFAVMMFLHRRRDVSAPHVRDLLLGSIVGAPIGVWLLTALPVAAFGRLVGVVLLLVVILEWRGLLHGKMKGRGWGVGAGVTAGVMGGALGMPAPPIATYAATQGWTPRVMKANVAALLTVNQIVVLGGYWWKGLLTREMLSLAATYAIPALLGLVAGMALFERVDQVKFRRIVFALLFVSGMILVIGR